MNNIKQGHKSETYCRASAIKGKGKGKGGDV